MLCSVYRRFKVLVKQFRKGRFTPDEDNLILEHVKRVKNNEPKFAPVARALNRTRFSVEIRYRVLMQGSFGHEHRGNFNFE